MTNRAARRSDISMTLVVLCWGLNMPLIKIALREIPILAFNGIRLVLASTVLVFILILRKESFTIPGRDLGKIFVLALSGHTFYQLLFIHGLNLTTVGNTAVIFAVSPILISLLSCMLGQERIVPMGWAGIAVGFCGVYLVISGRTGVFTFSWHSLRGDLLLLLAVCMWTVYSVFSKSLMKRYSPLKLTSLTMSIGTLFFIPFTLPAFQRIKLAEISMFSWGSLVYSGLFALSLSYLLWFRSVKAVGNSQTALFSNLQPIVSVLLGWWILKEKITSHLFAGTLFIFIGLWLTRRSRRIKENDANSISAIPAE